MDKPLKLGRIGVEHYQGSPGIDKETERVGTIDKCRNVYAAISVYGKWYFSDRGIFHHSCVCAE